MKVLLLIVLVLKSGYGRVAVPLDKLLDVIDNVVDEGVKVLPLPKPTEKTVTVATQSSPLTTDQTTSANNNQTIFVNIDDIVLNSVIDEPELLNKETGLILTPYIEDGRFEEARRASEVNSSIFDGVQSYSGYLTVNKTHNSNTFFWYFPVENQPLNETPWIIWLQGGPGASSLIGLFEEIGPFIVIDGVVKRRPFSWHQNHSLVFIDNPVGTGFSYTERPDGYATDMETYSQHLYAAVSQLVSLYAELRTAPLYVAGESYAGKYVPSLALELHRHLMLSDIEVNLKGIIIGNAYVDPPVLVNIWQSFYNFGLISPEDVNSLRPLIDNFENSLKTNSSHARINWSMIVSSFMKKSNLKQPYNVLYDKLPYPTAWKSFVETAEFRQAVHVAGIFRDINGVVFFKMEDFLSSARPKMEALLEHYQVMAYCGNLDMLLPCVSLSENYRTWEWSGYEQFVNATRHPFIYRNKLAGYFKTGGNFTEAIINGAGHMVPADRPAQMQDFVTRFTHQLAVPTKIKPLYRVQEVKEISLGNEVIPETLTNLILTPYLKEGRIEEARNASEVDANMFLGIKSYSGFITVNQTYDSNMFFWYFPVEGKPVNETPWIIWLQGGPGASSLIGLFEEIGPVTSSWLGQLKRNPNSWLDNYSLVFIDNPVGTGYSFTNDSDGFATDMETYSSHLYAAVSQLVSLYAELRTAPLYVAGESYAGKYVPSLALELHRHLMLHHIDINLKGLIVGNGLVDPVIFHNMTHPYYNFGLLGPEDMKEIKPYQDVLDEQIRLGDRTHLGKRKWLELLEQVLFRSNQRHAYNFLRADITIGSFIPFLLRHDVRKAIHVASPEFNYVNYEVGPKLAPDFLRSAKYKYELLLENYRVLTYCGQLDQMVPCVLNAENHRTWKWSDSKSFMEAPRKALQFNGRNVGGYGRVAVPLDKLLDVIDNVVDEGVKVLPLPKPTEKTVTVATQSSPLTTDQTTSANNNQTIFVNIDDIVLNSVIDEPELLNKETGLILTPYIEDGRFEEARRASEVNSSIFDGVQSYSGYLTVNKTHNSNTFFWYFPVENQPLNETPWIIWLQGGPGASSLIGLFEEIGPFIVIDGVVKRRPFSWHQNHSLVFIDNPVGTGFSYTERPDGYATDMETYSQHLYAAVSQLVSLYAELRTAPLYVAGESYAGKYVPSLALELHRHLMLSDIEVNLKGIIIGNAYVDPPVLVNIWQSFYNFGLISPEDVNSLRPLIDNFENSLKTNSSHARINWSMIVSSFMKKSNLKQPYNVLYDKLPYPTAWKSFVETAEFRQAVHVAGIFRDINGVVFFKMEDFLSSARPKMEALLEHYQVMAYCGNLDMLLPCVSLSENYRTWEWSGYEQFVNATRHPFIYRNKLAGYFKTGGNFTEAIINGAGHMVPADRPAQMQDFVTRFTHQLAVPTKIKPLYRVQEVKEISLGNEVIPETLTNLILTPYLKEGRIEEARNASEVDANMFLGIKSYSGFITVNQTYDSNMFFWYFPVEGKPVNETPWIIWLQGGPGASSLIGLFEEIGPVTSSWLGQLKRNPNSWLDNYSLVFIDNPVGTGYSFTNDSDGFATDMETYSSHLYAAVSQLVSLYAELRTAPLYVAGESYAGKYVPSLALELHRHLMLHHIDINLKGLIVGNGLVDPVIFHNMTHPYYNFGLLGPEDMKEIKPYQDVLDEQIRLGDRTHLGKRKWLELLEQVLFRSNQRHAYNFLRADITIGSFIPFLLRHDVRKAIHVASPEFNYVNYEVGPKLAPDFLRSAKYKYELLLENYRVLTYCGQLDQMVPCVLNAENHRTWKWSDSKSFMEAPRKALQFNGRNVGYIKNGGNFTEVMIRGAGHMATQDQPETVKALVSLWIDNKIAGVNDAKQKYHNLTENINSTPPLFSPLNYF